LHYTKNMDKRLPIGISSFEKIRREGYYYIDKTPFIAKLVSEGTYYFLSRPRRFGKSLFVDTLKQAFLGRRELFEGLYLYEHWDWSESYPVIHIDFGGGVVQDAKDLVRWILFKLRQNQSQLKITCEEREDYRNYFEELIVKSAETYGKQVVVLIDEYDKPILDRIEEREKAREIREVLKSLYSVLKPLDSYLKFVFITGVTKFSKVSLFSGLNQLQDITLSSKYATICGYTQEELEAVFGELLTKEELQGVRCWYNGYSFCGEPVYNPFDVLLYLSDREFRPYWFETGTPSFLVKLLFERRFYLPEMEEIIASENLLSSFDVDFIEPEVLLFQAGYLTIRRFEPTLKGPVYYLGYPNKEVRVALNESLVRYYTQQGGSIERLGHRVRKAFDAGKVEEFGEILKNLFASIPYEWYRRNNLSEYEGYYASVVYSFLAGTGLDLVAEDYTSRGRIDLVVRVDEKVYIIEFKVMDGDKARALEELKKKGYEGKYRGRVSEIYLVGIEFDPEERNIKTFEWERI